MVPSGMGENGLNELMKIHQEMSITSAPDHTTSANRTRAHGRRQPTGARSRRSSTRTLLRSAELKCPFTFTKNCPITFTKQDQLFLAHNPGNLCGANGVRY